MFSCSKDQFKHALTQSRGGCSGWAPCPRAFDTVPITTTTAQKTLLWRIVLQLWFNFTPPARQPTTSVSQLDLCCSLIHSGQLASQTWKEINHLFFPPFLISVSLHPAIPQHIHSIMVSRLKKNKQNNIQWMVVFMAEEQVFVFLWAVISGQQASADLYAD